MLKFGSTEGEMRNGKVNGSIFNLFFFCYCFYLLQNKLPEFTKGRFVFVILQIFQEDVSLLWFFAVLVVSKHRY